MGPTLHDMFVPYEVERFWDEYGPIIVDVLLALPFITFFRRLLTRRSNRYINETSRPSILQMPDELLLHISETVYFAEVATLNCKHRRMRRTLNGNSGFLSLSRTNKRIRNICAPTIFQTVSIAGNPDYGWLRASRSLKAAVRSQQGMEMCTKLSVKVVSYGDTSQRPPTRFSRSLAQLLPKYTNVRKFELIVPNISSTFFKKTFVNSNLTLPNLRILILNSHLEWIIPMLPNLEIISTSDIHWLTSFNGTWPCEQRYKLIKAASQAPRLRHFEMHENWNIELLRAVLRSLSKIQTLALPGGMYHDGIKALLTTLSQFRNLRTLVLASAADLDVGYHPPMCGNAFFGPEGEAYRRQVQEQGRRARISVGEMVFKKLKNLEVLWIGDYNKATVVETEFGERKVVWDHDYRVLPRHMK